MLSMGLAAGGWPADSGSVQHITSSDGPQRKAWFGGLMDV